MLISNFRRLRVKFRAGGTGSGHSSATQTTPGRRIALVLLSAAIVILMVEASLQIQSEILIGESIFNALSRQTRYVWDKRTGLKLLRPNQVFRGTKIKVRTNSLGLRSPEILSVRALDSVRIAVVGASTVMGVAAANNEDTFSALLESKLRNAFPGRTVEVINAGVAGYTLEEERLILKRLILPLKPDLVVAYTGVNDFRDYCDGSIGLGRAETAAQRRRVLAISLPSWLLSVRLILDNTAFLRIAPARPSDRRNPYSVDLRPYRVKLEALAKAVLEANTSLVIATNVRAYRPEQPLDEQLRLSFMARYYFNPCFEIAGLHVLHDLHNAEITDLGRHMGFFVLPLADRVPGGKRYFVDSIHLSNEGERLVADAIFEFLIVNKLVKF